MVAEHGDRVCEGGGGRRRIPIGKYEFCCWKKGGLGWQVSTSCVLGPSHHAVKKLRLHGETIRVPANS